MKKLNLIVAIACIVTFLVAGVLVALGKYPVVTEMEHDEANQMALLWILAVMGINFLVYKAEFSPMLDRFHNVTRVLGLAAAVVAGISYFTESLYDFADRTILQTSLILGLMTIGFYFMVRHFDSDVDK